MKNTSWEKSANWYARSVGQLGHYYHRRLILPALDRLAKLDFDDSVVDLGCGQGVLGRTLCVDKPYTGIDLSSSLIAEARHLDNDPKHKYICADVSIALPLPKRSFTVAFVVLAMQNIRDWEGLLATIDRLVADSGRVYVVLNHPYFRIPRHTGWEAGVTAGVQRRWIDAYMSDFSIPISTHPSRGSAKITWSFHKPLWWLVNRFFLYDFRLSHMEELVSDKESAGRLKRVEDRARQEIPLFMVLEWTR